MLDESVPDGASPASDWIPALGGRETVLACSPILAHTPLVIMPLVTMHGLSGHTLGTDTHTLSFTIPFMISSMGQPLLHLEPPSAHILNGESSNARGATRIELRVRLKTYNETLYMKYAGSLRNGTTQQYAHVCTEGNPVTKAITEGADAYGNVAARSLWRNPHISPHAKVRTCTYTKFCCCLA